MARLPRVSPIGIPQHIIQRRNNQQLCFVSEQGFVAYVHWLKEYAVKFNVDVHAWVLMTNHVHLLCIPRINDGIRELERNNRPILGRIFVCLQWVKIGA